MWLSEIILQQTRVDQGLPYWESFMESFPTIADLAQASEESVLRLWQGLGYYSRARNLHFTAKHVHEELNDQFPTTYDEIIKLKGVGPYTAAAIASICFEEPRPVVDGNVYRFASRFFGLKDDISQSGTRKVFESLLEKYIDQNLPGQFNQGMMEFGATICSPSPKCSQCTFQPECFAYSKGLQYELPIKTKKLVKKTRLFHYLVIRTENHFFMRVRDQKDVWKGLYEFFLLEGSYSQEEVFHKAKEKIIDEFTIESVSETVVHILSHQDIHSVFYEIYVNEKYTDEITQKTSLDPYSIEEVLNLPKPKLIVNHLNRLGIK